MSKKFTIGGLFSGVGGIELGFQQAGFQTVRANELDKHSSKTYRLNHGDHLKKMMFTFYKEKITTCRCFNWGFSCQAFSVAGYRKDLEIQEETCFSKSHD